MNWKNVFVFTVGIVVGFLIADWLAVGSLIWPEPSQKSWNSSAVTAKFESENIFLNESMSDKRTNYYNIYLTYSLTNNTNQDYTLPIPSESLKVMEVYSGGDLGRAPGLSWNIATKSWGYSFSLPAKFFDPEPVLIPALQTVRIDLQIQTAYGKEITTGKEPRDVANYALKDIDGFALLDKDRRYRIELSLQRLKSPLK